MGFSGVTGTSGTLGVCGFTGFTVTSGTLGVFGVSGFTETSGLLGIFGVSGVTGLTEIDFSWFLLTASLTILLTISSDTARSILAK